MLKFIGLIIICLHFINCDSGNDSTISETNSNYTFDLSYSEEINKATFYNVLSQRLLNIEAPLDFSKMREVSKSCRKDSRHFVNSLKNFDFWALQMHDASAKLPSGILNGNLNQFGDFDQCLDVATPDNNIQGQYCLTFLQPRVSEDIPYFEYLRKLTQSHDAIRSSFNDPGHRIPKFSTFNWAVCVPSSCTPYDVELMMKVYVEKFTNGTGIDVEVKVDDEMCTVKKVHVIENLDLSTKVAIGFFAGILIIVVLSSIYELHKGESIKNPWLVAFSLIKNTKELVSLKCDPGDIPTAHAIRCFNAVLLILSHKSFAMWFNPYSNRTEMSVGVGKSWSVLTRTASMYTDPFLMLSGMLTAYSFVGRLQKGQKIKILKEYIGRYLRIMPSLAALILFCTFVLPLLGSGPQWNLVVNNNSEMCKKYWWRNLLFIHNWFGLRSMCLSHTHHVGIDFELFLIAPILITLLWKSPKKGALLIFGLGTLSTIVRFYVTYTNGLSNYVFYGVSVTQLFETAGKTYILPPHRFTVYAMGIILGYILRTYKDIKLSQTQLTMGWYISTGLLLSAFCAPAPMGTMGYKFNPTHAAHYAAFAPIGWCLFFAWIIFTSQLGYKNKFTELLEWKGFQISTRLSYSIYLTQFPIFFFNVGRKRASIYFQLTEILNYNEIICIVIASILLTILVENPCNNMKNIIFNRTKASSQVITLKDDPEKTTIKSKDL